MQNSANFCWLLITLFCLAIFNFHQTGINPLCLYPWTEITLQKRHHELYFFYYYSKALTLDSTLQNSKWCIPFITNIWENNSHIFPSNYVSPWARIAYIQKKELCSIFVCELGGPIGCCICLSSLNTLILIIALGTKEYEYDKFILCDLTCVTKPSYNIL